MREINFRYTKWIYIVIISNQLIAYHTHYCMDLVGFNIPRVLRVQGVNQERAIP